MSFLQLENKNIVVLGVANKKSVAYHIGQQLTEQGANVIYVVRSPERRDKVRKLFPETTPIYVCDVEYEKQIAQLSADLKSQEITIHGLVHSIAFANFEGGQKPFHETERQHFLQTVDISCFSLISIANALKDLMDSEASVITISISTTEMTAESYGWMAPAKAALNSAVCFLAKSFSRFSNIRFNAVSPGLLKTSASAGIPGYIDNYLFAEQATLRKEAVKTEEVASTALFLLSPASRGINAQQIIIDAGMRLNYFDPNIIKKNIA